MIMILQGKFEITSKKINPLSVGEYVYAGNHLYLCVAHIYRHKFMYRVLNGH